MQLLISFRWIQGEASALRSRQRRRGPTNSRSRSARASRRRPTSRSFSGPPARHRTTSCRIKLDLLSNKIRDRVVAGPAGHQFSLITFSNGTPRSRSSLSISRHFVQVGFS